MRKQFVLVYSQTPLLMMTQSICHSVKLHEEDSSDDGEDLYDDSSDEEPYTQSIKFRTNGSYWNETPPTHDKTRSYNILRSCPEPTPGSRAVSQKGPWDMFMSDNILEEVLNCTNLEGQRTATAKKRVEKH